MRGNPNYAIWTHLDGQVRERDGFTCGHCQLIVLVRPRQTLWGKLLRGDEAHCNDVNEVDNSDVRCCPACQRYVCGRCAALQTCHVWEKKIEEMERRQSFFRHIDRENRERFNQNMLEMERRDAEAAEEEMRRRTAIAARGV